MKFFIDKEIASTSSSSSSSSSSNSNNNRISSSTSSSSNIINNTNSLLRSNNDVREAALNLTNSLVSPRPSQTSPLKATSSTTKKDKVVIDLLSDGDDYDVDGGHCSNAVYDNHSYHNYPQHYTDHFDALSNDAYFTPAQSPTKIRRINTETSTDKSTNASAVTTHTLVDSGRKGKNSITTPKIFRNTNERQEEFFELFFEINGVDENINDSDVAFLEQTYNREDVPVGICVHEAIDKYYSTKASGDRIKNIRIKTTKSLRQFIDLPVDTEDDDDGEIEA